MGSGLVCSDGAANSGGAAPGAAEHSAEDRGRCPSGAAPLRSTGREPSVTPPAAKCRAGALLFVKQRNNPVGFYSGFFFSFFVKTK